MVSAIIQVSPIVQAGITDEVNSIQLTIDRIANEKGLFSEDLYPHIKRLAKVQLSNNDLDNAIRTFRRLQVLVHHHDGVYSAQQFESVDWLIRLHTAKGNLETVNQLQEFRYSAAQHNYPPDSAQMLEPLLKISSWYRETRQYNRSLALLQQSRHVIRQNQMARSKLILTLRSEALTRYLAGICCADQALKEVDALLTGNVDTASIAHMELSDMMFLTNKNSEAISFSNHAIASNGSTRLNWEPMFLGFSRQKDIVESYKKTLVRVSKSASNMEIIFVRSQDEPVHVNPVIIGSPVPVCRQGAANLIGPSIKRLDDFFVDVDLKIDSSGNVFDIQLKGSAPPRLQTYLRNILREAKYRPGIANNQIANETSLSFRQTFDPTRVNHGSEWGLILNFQACTLLPVGSVI
jgi:hypothetical protein